MPLSEQPSIESADQVPKESGSVFKTIQKCTENTYVQISAFIAIIGLSAVGDLYKTQRDTTKAEQEVRQEVNAGATHITIRKNGIQTGPSTSHYPALFTTGTIVTAELQNGIVTVVIEETQKRQQYQIEREGEFSNLELGSIFMGRLALLEYQELADWHQVETDHPSVTIFEGRAIDKRVTEQTANR